MKKKAFNLLLGLFILLNVTACGLFKKTPHQGESVIAGQSMYMTTYEFDSRQLDSLFTADNLPKNLNKDWTRKSYTDYETQEQIIRYFYMKEYSETYELTYIITPKGDIYIVSKREVKAQ